MAEQLIRLLTGEWSFDDTKPLGRAGGFGEVFKGSGPKGNVAVKRLKLTASQAAHRELNINEILMKRGLQYVVRVLDAGLDAESDRYFLIMPICDHSLQDTINSAPGKLAASDIRKAVLDIISGLLEVSDLVHRDLKPSNVLFHDGTWKIADFGIAKFIEDATSLETLRNFLTAPYAAPEQWLGERATSATDIYSLGCIIHALADGQPPFHGVSDIREAHLRYVPKRLTTVSQRWATFVAQMLRKPPSARPSIERCGAVLSTDPREEVSGKGLPEILKAAQEVNDGHAIREAEEIARRELDKRREAIGADGVRELTVIWKRIIETLREHSEAVAVESPAKDGLHEVAFGAGTLLLGTPTLLRPPDFHPDAIKPVAWARIRLTCSYGAGFQASRSATIYYAEPKNGGGFRWYEAAFWSPSGWHQSYTERPFYLEPQYQEFAYAVLDQGYDRYRLAYGPLAIDAEDEEGFLERWLKWMARAAVGELRLPADMPLISFDV